MNLLGILEGILFVVGDEGITLNQICEILNVDLEESKRLLMELKKTYETEDRGIRISYLGDAFKLTTKKEHKEYYQRLIETPESNTLSPAALETLAIIAYNQPVTRAYVDTVRGVDSSYAVSSLVERGMIESKSRLDAPGRPMLYTTTSAFLRCFGLTSLDELPKLSESDVSLLDSLKEMGGENAAEAIENTDSITE